MKNRDSCAKPLVVEFATAKKEYLSSTKIGREYLRDIAKVQSKCSNLIYSEKVIASHILSNRYGDVIAIKFRELLRANNAVA